MTLLLTVYQTCDGCGTARQFDVAHSVSAITTEQLAKMPIREGWREVKTNKHLCRDCIQKALERPLPAQHTETCRCK